MEDSQFCKMKLFNFQTRCIMEDYQLWKLNLVDFQTRCIMENTHLKTVISPGSKFHVATLLIKRKPLNIDFAGTFVDCWRLPFDFSSVIETSFGHQCHLVFSISIVEKNDIRKPNMLRGHIQHFHSTIIRRIPFHLVIHPFLFQPNVSCHHLIFEVDIDQLRQFQA